MAAAKQVDVSSEEFDTVEQSRTVVIADLGNGRRRVYHSLSPQSPVKLTLAGFGSVVLAIAAAVWFMANKLNSIERKTCDGWGGLHVTAAEVVREKLNTQADVAARGYKGLTIEQVRGIQRALKTDEGNGI